MGKSGVGKVDANEQAYDMLQEMRHWIEEQERILRGFMESEE